MTRNNPCKACKKRQKRCQWKDSTICVLCKKLQLQCVPSNLEISNDANDVMPREFGIKTLEYWYSQLGELDSTLQLAESTVAICRDKQRQLQNKEWKLVVKDGVLRLLTPIECIDELIMFTQASLRYLSPLNGIIKTQLFQFENSSSNVIQRSFFRIYNRSIETHHGLHSPQPSPRLISITVPEIRSIADDLIHLYLEQVNPKLPLLYAPTFLEHYHSLVDPLSCPVILAVCVHTTSSNRYVLNYSAHERRYLGDLYYDKCKKILVDIFDDPTKRLETIFTISFLYHYLILGLARLDEARRLATISYLLCKEVEPTIDDNDESPVSILFKRHYLYLQYILCILDDLIDQSVSKPFPVVLQLQKISGESKVTCGYIDTYNHILRLSNHPCLKGMMVWTVFTKKTSNHIFNLETILESDRAIRNWWDSLPTSLRIHENFSGEDVDKAVEECTSMEALVLFAYLHASIIQIQTCLITPKRNPDEDESNTAILYMLQEKAISTIQRSCELVLSAATSIITSPELDIPIFTSLFLSRVIHAFINISLCPNTEIPATLQHRFYQCIQLMRSQMPSDNQIPPSISPINTYLSTNRLGDVTVYQSYPFPGIALIEDIFATFHDQLQSSFANGKEDYPSPKASIRFSLSDSFTQ